jgi:hypothetical protein
MPAQRTGLGLDRLVTGVEVSCLHLASHLCPNLSRRCRHGLTCLAIEGLTATLRPRGPAFAFGYGQQPNAPANLVRASQAWVIERS